MSRVQKGKKAGKGKAGELSRKERRKEDRKAKKRTKQQFLLGRVGKTVGKGNKANNNSGANVKKVDAAEAKAAVEERRKRKLAKEQAKVRKKRLREDNRREDEEIKSLEKKLKMNKGPKNKKTKDKEAASSLPKAFVEDGLDFLLDACDADKLSQWNDEELGEEDVSGEEGQSEGDGEEEEDDEQDQEEMAESGEEEEGDEEGGAEEEGEDDQSEEEGDGDEEEEEAGGGDGTWEDIYGRTRDAAGNVVPDPVSNPSSVSTTAAAPAAGKYIPPALRAKLAAASLDEDQKRKERLARLRRRCKGVLNRLAAANMSSLAREMEEVYSASGHARADVSQCLFSLLAESLVDSPVRTPERLVLEHALLLGVLHANVGQEVGGALLQACVEKYVQVRKDYREGTNSKEQDNALLLIAHLFTFRVAEARLVFDILSELVEAFSEKDVDLIVTVLKAVGFGLRKADPARLKELILNAQRKSAEAKKEAKKEEDSSMTRVSFMLEVLAAIKNNNVRKIPNFDDDHQQFLLKNMKQWVRPDSMSSPLAVGLKDLTEADSRGRWWIVGSAWAGKNVQGRDDDERRRRQQEESAESEATSYSAELLEKARQMRMNTDARRAIFCAVMSADDYLDAFERLVKLRAGGKQKEREVAFVVLDCCLQERRFNPFYSQLAGRLAEHDRKHMLAAQFALWDKVKAIDGLDKTQADNLGRFAAALVARAALPFSALKVVEFADMDKRRVAFLRKVLGAVLEAEEDTRKKVFASVAGTPALSTLREGIRLFMRHFMLKKEPSLLKVIESAEDAMMGEGKLRL